MNEESLGNLSIVKVGGSVLTMKGVSPPQIKMEVLSRIAEELKAHSGPMIVVLGGGAHGHQAAHAYGFGDQSTPEQRLLAGISSIRHNMSLLALTVEQELNKHGIPAVVFSPYMTVLTENGIVKEFPTWLMRRALLAGLVVVTHGDVCHDTILGASILSGDRIVVLLAHALSAQLVLVGTDVDGIFEEDPRVNPSARHLPEVNRSNIASVLGLVGPSRSTDVTGGMARKVNELLDLAEAEQFVAIFNLLVPGRLVKLLRGESTVATIIT